jgi:hypothetical protein
MDIQANPDPAARTRELGAEIIAAADEIERSRQSPFSVSMRLIH